MTIQSTLANAFTDAVRPLSDDAQRQVRNLSQQTLSPDMLPSISDDAEEERVSAQRSQARPDLYQAVSARPASVPQASASPAVYGGGWLMARPAVAGFSNAMNGAFNATMGELAEPLKTEGPRIIRDMLDEEQRNKENNQSNQTAQGSFISLAQPGYPAPARVGVPNPMFAPTPQRPVGQVLNRIA